MQRNIIRQLKTTVTSSLIFTENKKTQTTGIIMIMKKKTKIDEKQSIQDCYDATGYYFAKNIFDKHDFFNIEKAIALAISSHHPCQNIHSSDIALFLKNNLYATTEIYDNLQNNTHLLELGKTKKIVDIVRLFIAKPALYSKIVLRIDIPFESKELSYWHQDDFYVKGNEDELTVWIPLQNTSVPQGCLSVMPGSHKLGRLEHSYASGKKHVPQGIYSREIRLVEMMRYDALFFSSFLVHSSNFNFSEHVRYSIQLRYTSQNKEPSKLMRGTLNV
jgi:ectoine hydroxylase-related dioxygenase (phytanoyl-CoA dioxygenase family)